MATLARLEPDLTAPLRMKLCLSRSSGKKRPRRLGTRSRGSAGRQDWTSLRSSILFGEAPTEHLYDDPDPLR